MICKHCGKETANVICDNCGINVIWYNKYGVQRDIENSDELQNRTIFLNDNKEVSNDNK